MKSRSKITKVLLGGVVLLLVFALASYAAAQSVTLISNDTKLTDPGALATDGTNLFVGNGNRIFVVPIGGGAATELPAMVATNLYPSPCCVVGLTRLGSSLFWIDPNGDPDATAIFKVSTSGGAVTKIYSGFATGQPIVDGVGIATDGTKLYTTDDVQGRVHSLNPDGSGITFLGSRFGGFFFGEHFNTLAVSDGTIFIVDPGNAQVGPFQPELVSIPVTGGSFTTIFAGSPLVTPLAVAVGNGMIFIADPGAGNTIWQVPIGGGTPTALVSGAPFVQLSANGLIFFNNALYVSDNGNVGATNGPGVIYRVDFEIPFASFAAKVEIELSIGQFEVNSTFTLGAGSNGIAALTEDVHLQVGAFSTTIPAGSFKQDKKGRFKFEGTINGVALEAVIRPLGGNQFEFKAEGTGATNLPTQNPVTVKLTIGDDDGSTTVEAEFE